MKISKKALWVGVIAALVILFIIAYQVAVYHANKQTPSVQSKQQAEYQTCINQHHSADACKAFAPKHATQHY